MKCNRFPFLVFLLSLTVLALLAACRKELDKGSFTPKDPQLSFSSENFNVLKSDSSYEIAIQSNLPWRAKSNTAWIAVNDSTDSGLGGDSLIRIKVNKNPTTEERTGTITVWITSDYEKIITITQEAGDPPPIIKRHVYVKEGGSGDGSSWSNAASLDAALALDLDAGDFIHIAAGVYKPATPVTGGTPGTAGDYTFEIKENIILIGGYPANAADGAVADPALHATVLDGENTANHVVTVSAPAVENQQVIIRGITIQKGNTAASGSVTINGLSYGKNFGGGIIIGRASVALEQCTLTDNTAVSGGGAIYTFTQTYLSLKNCVVKNNKTTSSGANGGAIFIDKQSDLTVSHSTITNNAAGSFAGGLYVYLSNFHIYNTTIDGNGAGGLGSATAGKAYGGLYLREGSGELVNCTVYGNTASNIGGGIGVYGTASAPATLNVVSTTITGNKVIHASASGGGLYVNALSATVNVVNSIISGNTKGATGTESASDVAGVAGFAWSKKNTVESAQVFDGNGAAVPGATFDVASMLGALADNGGETRTCKLQGSANPATTNGMSAEELIAAGNALPLAVAAEIMTVDQTDASRSGKAYIGACVR